MQNILSGFLNAGLLQIGEDDEKLKLLEAAAAALASQIKTKPPLAYRFALTGFDDRSGPTDPTVKEAEKAVLEQWQTLVNKVGPSPIQVYRAVILRSLELAASAIPSLNQALPLIVENEPALHSSGKEREVIEAMLGRFQSIAVDELTATWVNPVDLSLPKITGKVKKPQVSKEDLNLAFARAAGPLEKDGKPLVTPNPHWPNAGQPWAFEYASRAAEGVHAAIQSTYSGLPEELKGAMIDAVKELVSSVERLAIRDAKSELLWMRASMYSPSARKSYRDLQTPTEMLFHAVLDTTRVVNSNSPPSVEFFLGDLVAELSTKKLKLQKVLGEIGSKSALFPETQAIAAEDFSTTGRRPWLDIAIRPDLAEPFDHQAGVSNDYEETAAELAVRFYREFQIRKILAVNQ